MGPPAQRAAAVTLSVPVLFVSVPLRFTPRLFFSGQPAVSTWPRVILRHAVGVLRRQAPAVCAWVLCVNAVVGEKGKKHKQESVG